MTPVKRKCQPLCLVFLSCIFLWIKEPRWYGLKILFSFFVHSDSLCVRDVSICRALCGCLYNCIAYSFATAFSFHTTADTINCLPESWLYAGKKRVQPDYRYSFTHDVSDFLQKQMQAFQGYNVYCIWFWRLIHMSSIDKAVVSLSRSGRSQRVEGTAFSYTAGGCLPLLR